MRCLLIISVLLLSACEPRTRIIYQDVYKSVPTECPKPEKLNEPLYPIYLLKPSSTPKQIAEAYVNSLQMCRTEIKIRDELLDVYRNYKVGDSNDNPIGK